MPLHFIIWMGARIIVAYVAAAALISGVYLVQQFVPLLDTSMRYAISGWVLGKMLLFTLPRLIEFALPLASLAVAYFVFLEARERREFLILSASGASSSYLSIAVLLTGMVAAAISLGVSGFVKPAASFAYRSTQTESRNEVLSKEIPVGAFYSQLGTVLYSGGASQGALRTMRLFEFDGERLDQIVVSDCSKMKVVDGVVVAETCDLKGYRFGGLAAKPREDGAGAAGAPDCEICLDESGQLPVSTLTAGPSTFSVVMDRVFRTAVRDRSAELNLFELLRADADRFVSERNANIAGTKFLSAISCVIGILFALVAAAFTSFRTRLLPLPLASVAMMGVMVLLYSQTWVLAVEAGRLLFFAKLFGAAAACVPLVWLASGFTYRRLVAPAPVKA